MDPRVFSCYLYGKMVMFGAANMKTMLEQADTLNTNTCFGKAFSQKLQVNLILEKDHDELLLLLLLFCLGSQNKPENPTKDRSPSFLSCNKKVSPEATIREFKGQLLHQWQTDRSKLCVRLVLHDHVLVNDNETVVHAGWGKNVYFCV